MICLQNMYQYLYILIVIPPTHIYFPDATQLMIMRLSVPDKNMFLLY